MVTLDWNKDGRPDLAIGHLYEDDALLTNTCSSVGNFVAIKFAGTQSSRDAIGVSVSCDSNGRKIVRQVTAGDGYQASNQQEIIFGCGAAQTIQSMTVVWPSGQSQTFDNVSTNCRYVLREGNPSLLRLP
jgi:hypothetical protein